MDALLIARILAAFWIAFSASFLCWLAFKLFFVYVERMIPEGSPWREAAHRSLKICAVLLAFIVFLSILVSMLTLSAGCVCYG